MDIHATTGKVYLQSHKDKNKWKPISLSLFSSSSGAGRLEIQDMGGVTGWSAGADRLGGLRKHHLATSDRKLKVILLSDILNVVKLPRNAEACPMDNMCAFCVETKERTMVFSAPKDKCVQWVKQLSQHNLERGAADQIVIEENQIYASADEDFRVVVQQTEAAVNCELKGSYWLQVGEKELLLKDLQKNIIWEWPYEWLRRYGKDKLALTIEAGRRCNSGPGTFNFETPEAAKIFSLMKNTIKQRSSGTQKKEDETQTASTRRGHSPLPRTSENTSLTSFLENKLGTTVKLSDASEHKTDSVSPSSVQPAPITLMPLPKVPTQKSPVVATEPSDAVYADPLECLQPTPKGTEALYVDPASVLPVQPPGSRITAVPTLHSSNLAVPMSPAESVYSEVFDKITPLDSTNVRQCLKNIQEGDPIYAEVHSEKVKESATKKTKPDAFSHLYARVCKPSATSGESRPNDDGPSVCAAAKCESDQILDDVIYENLGVI
ncbi:docking protein 2-like isoform X1 [Synchiropus splendidus]|uniref:docking protein 2-like isoform X1 n=3 Tax=Synchiropus splendidus TaxID=270530 RepID=UPI00237E2034|nr:docking protein 2-like isoform X1 [Synchiropus splendidus]